MSTDRKDRVEELFRSLGRGAEFDAAAKDESTDGQIPVLTNASDRLAIRRANKNKHLADLREKLKRAQSESAQHREHLLRSFAAESESETDQIKGDEFADEASATGNIRNESTG